MAILKIARMGHPALITPAMAVDQPQSAEIKALVADMIETMIDADGTGLAAPQVHVGLRVVVFLVDASRISEEEELEEGGGIPLTVLINPEIEPLSDEMELGWEGCLSVPGMSGEVPRHSHIRYRGVGLDGKPIQREARGFHARVVQHECDHLDGILYPSRVVDMSRFGFTDALAHGLNQPNEEPDEDPGEGQNAK
ncbi:MAG: peptide deformylase [Rhodospirillaceae bacterium]|nr:peptide deformylase [Rhodospirillaceae bacterium]